MNKWMNENCKMIKRSNALCVRRKCHRSIQYLPLGCIHPLVVGDVVVPKLQGLMARELLEEHRVAPGTAVG